MKYAVHVPYDNPVEHKVYVDKPYPVVKEVKVPHEVKVPAPYPVEKVVHYPVHIVSLNSYYFYEINLITLYVYYQQKVPVEKLVPIYKEVKYAVHVPYDRPVPHKVYVDKPYPVEKIVKVPVEKEVKYPVVSEFKSKKCFFNKFLYIIFNLTACTI